MLDFECLSEGNPAAKSSFLLNGNQATLGRRVKAVRTLRNITCIAENDIGSDSSTQVQKFCVIILRRKSWGTTTLLDTFRTGLS